MSLLGIECFQPSPEGVHKDMAVIILQTSETVRLSGVLQETYKLWQFVLTT